MNAVVASLAGTTLGRYRLVEKLGQGGMATVYRAEDPTLGRQVAVKVMHPFIAERSEAGSRFEREAKAVAGLRHANVMALHDYAPASAEHPAYLVMELLTGPSLHRFLVEHGAPLGEVAAMLGLRIAQALGAAHAHGIVHRDVKPENVMFDGHRVVLCDFGIARIVASDGVTATGAVLGSPAYMSPEQASGGEVDARSDQFSLGSLLYQLATGALPFSGTSPLVTMAKIVKGDHAPPSAKNPRVPPYLERAIERLLRGAPGERFPSVDACAEALRDGLGADGFADVDAELAAYLRDPAAYNAAAEGRIVAAAQAQAAGARSRGETARALSAASRVLSWRPNDATALALTAGMSARPRRLAMVAVGALLVVAGAGAIGWRALRVRELDGKRPSAVSSQLSAPEQKRRSRSRRRCRRKPAEAKPAETLAKTPRKSHGPALAHAGPPAPSGATAAPTETAAPKPTIAPVAPPQPARRRAGYARRRHRPLVRPHRRRQAAWPHTGHALAAARPASPRLRQPELAPAARPRSHARRRRAPRAAREALRHRAPAAAPHPRRRLRRRRRQAGRRRRRRRAWPPPRHPLPRRRRDRGRLDRRPARRLHPRRCASPGMRQTVTTMSRSGRAPRENPSNPAWLASCSGRRS